jgi:formamidopyrimidine-DNA glycosylase
MSINITGRSVSGLKQLQFPLKILSVNAKGKFIWFAFEHKHHAYYLMNTLGLTGKWSFNPIKYTLATFVFDDETKLYFADMRHFGTLKFTDDIDVLHNKLNTLAPDFSTRPFTDSQLYRKLQTIHKPILLVIMSQTLVGSGIGNYLAAEILYTAKLSPHRIASSLTQHETSSLNKAIAKVITSCCRKTTRYVSHLGYNLPEYQFKVYRRKYDEHNNPVKSDRLIKGRTIYWVPDLQH